MVDSVLSDTPIAYAFTLGMVNALSSLIRRDLVAYQWRILENNCISILILDLMPAENNIPHLKIL